MYPNFLRTGSERSVGLLLHPTSLPGPEPIGTLGAQARAWVDWLAVAGVRWWQTLPLTLPGGGNSPYASPSSLAGNYWLLDLADLVTEGLLTSAEADLSATAYPAVDFAAVHDLKRQRLALAADRFLALPASAPLQQGLLRWRLQESWSLDVAVFLAVSEERNWQSWWKWPATLRDRHASALLAERTRLQREVDQQLVWQFLFDRQWSQLRQYALARGVRFLGDVPMYVDANSADTWVHRAQFDLLPTGSPRLVAGVPPDYFSPTGQRWGNPLYNWPAMKRRGFSWWRQRLARSLQWSDALRIDHFRGFSAYWALDADAPDATQGAWLPGPGRALFDALSRSPDGKQQQLPLVAEDLGIVDAAVETLRDDAGLPGMLVLQFAFGATASNPFLPHHHTQHAVVYTGTHDNDTTAGWWSGAEPAVQTHMARYLTTPQQTVDAASATVALMRLALASPARLAVLPVQDVLQLGTEARLNVPGKAEDNWVWRLGPGQDLVSCGLTPGLAASLRSDMALYDRLRPASKGPSASPT
jgi:4-alpha-glucanotransferase